MILLSVLLAFMSSTAPAPASISDAELVAFASKPFTPGNRIPDSYVLGIHHGAKVMIDFRCGDICPQYTTRLIHYDAEPGPACDRIGGRTQTKSFVQGIGVVRKDFCVPAVLVDKNL